MEADYRVVATQRVKEGAALLDQSKPDWFTKIDPSHLHMDSCAACVLGQVYGEYGQGILILDIGPGGLYGFDTLNGDIQILEKNTDPDEVVVFQDCFRILRDLWVDEIKARYDRGFDV